MVPNAWKVKRLSQITEFLKDGTHGTHKRYESGVPMLSAKNITKQNTIDFDGAPRISEEDYNKIHAKYTILSGDILLTVVGTLGRVALVPEKLAEKFTLQRSVAIIRVDPKKAYNQFLTQLFSGSDFTNLLQRKSNSTAQAGIYLGELGKLKILLPPLPEQQKIAKILTTWDKAISTTERLIDNSTQQKKALMQQLLTGKKRLLDESGKRFEGEWEEVQLGELAFIDKKSLGKSTPDDFEFKYISLSDVSEGVISNSTETYVYESAPSRARRLISENDVLLSTVRPNLKGFAKAKAEHDGFVASTGFSVITAKKQASSDYIYHYVFGEHITRQIYALVVGSNYPAINSSEVSKLKILKPSLEEQQKIAAVLTNTDKEIELLEQQLADLQQEKKALMQVLLTGKKRVRVDEIV